MTGQELVRLDDEKYHQELNGREREIYEQGFAHGHLRGFAEGEAKQAMVGKKVHERFVNDLRASWQQPAL